jgi:hypothetical protein
MTTSSLSDELARSLTQQAGLAPAQAAQTVEVLLRFLAARLPSPLFGELQARLGQADDLAPLSSELVLPAAPVESSGA